jgi:phosphate starvation-inducible PhoH-like protein
VEISHQRAGRAEVESPALLLPRRSELTARTPRQAEYLQAMRNFDITFCIGPAGTGKTFLAVAAAVDSLERDAVKRIVLTRPAVEAGEKLGFLPGDLAQKVDPYLRPLYDALYDLMGYDKVSAPSSAAPSRSPRSRSCAGARSTTRSSSSTRRRTPRPSR